MNRKTILTTAGLISVSAVVGFGVRALADGIPSPSPLYYSGTLTENGALVTAARTIGVFLYSDATSTNPLCQTIASNTQVTAGRFRIALNAACKAQINANANVFVEVVDGTVSLGRAALGAVPYAVEADRASGASGPLAQQVVPAGAVLYFNLPACPPGWSDLAPAQGRYIVGLPPAGTLASTVGAALTDKENRAVGQHSHTVTDPGHLHGLADPGHSHTAVDQGHVHGAVAGTGALHYWYWNSATCASQTVNFQQAAAGACGTPSDATGGGNAMVIVDRATTGITVDSVQSGIAVDPAGSIGGTNAPYIELRVCQKN